MATCARFFNKSKNEAIRLDRGLLEALVNDKIPDLTFDALEKQCGGDITLAANVYLDCNGDLSSQTDQVSSESLEPSNHSPSGRPTKRRKSNHNWKERRLGTFSCSALIIYSGKNIINFGDYVYLRRPENLKRPIGDVESQIVRNQIASGSGKVSQIVDVVDKQGRAIARLSPDLGRHLSVLLDLDLVSVSGTCIFAENNLKLGSSVLLQFECSLHRKVFDPFSDQPQLSSQVPIAIGLRKRPRGEPVEEFANRVRHLAFAKLFALLDLEPECSQAETPASNKLFDRREALALAADQADFAPPSSPGHEDSDIDNEKIEEPVIDPNQLDAIYSTAQPSNLKFPEADPASTFTMNLRPYQRQGLGWMTAREDPSRSDRNGESLDPLWEKYKWPDADESDEDEYKYFFANLYNGLFSLEYPGNQKSSYGGILADEMGLGKTISTMALIHSNRNSRESVPQSVSDIPEESFAPFTTLIVTPMSLLAQWESEIYACSSEGSMKVLVYYGNDRWINLRDSCCGKNSRTLAPDIILTTYGTVLSEHNRAQNSGTKNFISDGNDLFSLTFFRVVLDEAHGIRNCGAKISKACHDIKAERRWLLTGTPIINKLDDLFSMVRFLDIKPWRDINYWNSYVSIPFKKGNYEKALNSVQTIMEPILLRRTKAMKTPDGRPLVELPERVIQITKLELSDAEREIYNFIFERAKTVFDKNLNAGTVMKAYSTILAQILRLRQAVCHPGLLYKSETELEDNRAKENSLRGEQTGSPGTQGDDWIIDRLKPKLELYAELSRPVSTNNSISNLLKGDDSSYVCNKIAELSKEAEGECPVCTSEPIANLAVTKCFHVGCLECLLSHIEFQKRQGADSRCPVCREQLSTADIYQIERTNNSEAKDSNEQGQIILRPSLGHQSTKLQALIKSLLAVRAENLRAKSVVFSQFTGFLTIISNVLEQQGIPHLRFDGSMSQKERAEVLSTFQNPNSDKCVLLLSLKAGGVGLNLVSATRAYLMDPWWSYSVESQAIDRIHRMGQTNSVIITRYIVQDSVEEKMLKIQQRKMLVAQTVQMDQDQNYDYKERQKQERLDELKDLFGK